jgi:hypothetical protein
MNKGLNRLIGLTVSAFLAVIPLHAPAQALDLSKIDATLFRTYHTNLFVAPTQNRGFTRKADPAIFRTPASQHDAARDYIYASFARLGLVTALDPFSFSTNFGGPTYTYTLCNNVIGILPGVNPAAYGVYIVSAFYDTLDTGQPLPTDLAKGLAPRSPGADLNASGVAAVLCAATALSQQRFMATIIFIAFDASEKNFGGSYHYVQHKTTLNPAKTNKLYRGAIRSMTSIDTVGYNPPGDGHNTAILWGGSAAPSRARVRLANAVLSYGGIPTIQGGSISSSDHVPFWEAGIDSCVLSERTIWSNPYIYTSLDSTAKAGYIDYTYASALARGVAGYLTQWAVPAKQLTVAATHGGSVTGSTGWIRSGSQVALTARPDLFWQFSRWSGDTAGCTISNLTILVPMTMDRSITAIFSVPAVP